MKTNYLAIIFLLFFISIKGQNENNKWAFGASLASAKYTAEQGKTIGGIFITQTPRLNISRYMFSNIIFDAGFSTVIGDNQKYTTFDGILRYDFGTSKNNVVPYLLIGGSFIYAKSLSPTVNFGAGNTFWFSPRYGLNIQVMYKFTEDRFKSQKSHVYTSVGLVYSLGLRSLVPRLWNQNH